MKQHIEVFRDRLKEDFQRGNRMMFQATVFASVWIGILWNTGHPPDEWPVLVGVMYVSFLILHQGQRAIVRIVTVPMLRRFDAVVLQVPNGELLLQKLDERQPFWVRSILPVSLFLSALGLLMAFAPTVMATLNLSHLPGIVTFLGFTSLAVGGSVISFCVGATQGLTDGLESSRLHISEEGRIVRNQPQSRANPISEDSTSSDWFADTKIRVSKLTGFRGPELVAGAEPKSL